MTYKEPLDLSKLTKREFPYLKKMDFQQEDMVTKLFKKQRVIVDAVAGSGKTTVMTQAMNALKNNGYISKVYYVVFPVQESSLGYLPGDVDAKIKEYAIPFFQALESCNVNINELNMATMCDVLAPGDFKIVPHTFLRGRTISDAGVIIDEIQNGTVTEIKKTLTRIDDSCYVAMLGHNGQIDIETENSGFSKVINHFKQGKQTGIYDKFDFAELTHDYRGAFSSFADQLR